MKARLFLLAAACIAAFVWLHTGAPGDAACERARFSDSSGFSAWPPGARCEFGEPAQTDVVLNGWFAAVIFVVVVVFAVARPRALERQ